MFFYAVKKTFFDLWDHLFFALAVNLVFTLATLGLASLSFLFQGFGPTAQFAIVPVPFLVAAVLGGLATFWAKDIAFDGAAKVSDFVPHLAASWRPSVVFGVGWLVLVAGFLFGVPFYSSLHPLAGFIFGVVLAWALFFGAGMSLYYPGLNAQIEPKIGKLFKKSFLVFLANPWASLTIAVVFVLSLILSVVTLGFFPGILGISLWLQVGFKFLMAKYEWIEAHPDEDHKKVPWATILSEDMEKVGPRSFKSLIFPWKD